MSLSDETILQVLAPICGKTETTQHRGDLTITVDVEDIEEAALELRDNPETQFAMLTDVTAIDWYDKRKPRFDVIYSLLSMVHSRRLLLRVPIEEDPALCPSVASIWESADWYERETYDMYGISFDGHPDHRRFFMPEDFRDPETNEPLYPLRKDFPLMGIPGSLPLPDKDPNKN